MNRERLLQEDHIDKPHGAWRVLVICQCLNMTSWRQAEPFLDWFFETYPQPGTFLRELHEKQLRARLIFLGLVNRRFDYLVRMTQQYLKDYAIHGKNYAKYDVKSFTGCGQYAVDAWTLFVLREPCSPKDERLKAYAERVGLLNKGE